MLDPKYSLFPSLGPFMEAQLKMKVAEVEARAALRKMEVDRVEAIEAEIESTIQRHAGVRVTPPSRIA